MYSIFRRKNPFILSILLLAFSYTASAQIEKPKPTTTTKPKPATTPATSSQAIIEVTWNGEGTAIIHVGDKEISLTNKEKGELILKPGVALVIQVQKPAKTYSYADFVKFSAGKNYLVVDLKNEIVRVNLESEDQRKTRIENENLEKAHLARVGAQVWMIQNLNTDYFRNGDPIAQAQTPEEWKKARVEKKAAWCYYNNNDLNGTRDGKLYNWYAVNDPRGLAPKGWHIPNDLEWKTLVDHLGGAHSAGKNMKSTTGWSNDGNGTNTINFSAYPAGVRDEYGQFKYFGNYAYFWSSTEINENNAGCCNLQFHIESVDLSSDTKAYGFSVRLLRD